jgi:pimeloyl-ACP methyl ester carboxylesterase
VNAPREWQDLPTELDGIVLSHRMRAGDVPILMVHGIGPGTTGQANFGPLFGRLAPRLALHLIDLAGFGASGRKAEPPFFDVSFWLRQIERAIDRVVELHARAPLLIGNSVGAALALKAAAAWPGRMQVLAIGTPAGPPAPSALRSFWTAPRNAEALAAAMRPMTSAAAAPDPALVQARLRPFMHSDYGDYFNAMLADPDICLRAVALTRPEAARLGGAVTLMHGRQDRACPVSALLTELLPLLPDADVMVLGDCGHTVISERTTDVIATIESLIERVDLQ